MEQTINQKLQELRLKWREASPSMRKIIEMQAKLLKKSLPKRKVEKNAPQEKLV